jgi:hypothetical protein
LPETQEVVVDGFGNAVIGRMANVLKHRTPIIRKFKRIRGLLREMVRTHHPAFRNGYDEMQELSRRILDFCEQHLPFTVCPACRDVKPERKCLCRDRGWVTARQYNEWIDTREV